MKDEIKKLLNQYANHILQNYKETEGDNGKLSKDYDSDKWLMTEGFADDIERLLIGESNLITPQEELAKKAIIKIKYRMLYLLNQQSFCNQHGFDLEAKKFGFASEELRKISSQIEDIFDTGYVSIEAHEH